MARRTSGSAFSWFSLTFSKTLQPIELIGTSTGDVTTTLVDTVRAKDHTLLANIRHLTRVVSSLTRVGEVLSDDSLTPVCIFVLKDIGNGRSRLPGISVR